MNITSVSSYLASQIKPPLNVATANPADPDNDGDVDSGGADIDSSRLIDMKA